MKLIVKDLLGQIIPKAFLHEAKYEDKTGVLTIDGSHSHKTVLTENNKERLENGKLVIKFTSWTNFKFKSISIIHFHILFIRKT
jgi:hypothetical protein